MLDLLLSTDFICLCLFVVVIILGSIVAHYSLAVKDFKNTIREMANQTDSIVQENLALKQQISRLESYSKENDTIRSAISKSRRSSAKWCARYNAISDRNKVMQQQMVDIKLENAILRAALGNNTDLQSPAEAQVYVSSSGRGKYHTVVHGSWSGYKLMSLKSAIEKGYTPCSSCFYPVWFNR